MRSSSVGQSHVPLEAINAVIGVPEGRLRARGPTIAPRWPRASWASSTSRPTRSPTAASGSTLDAPSPTARRLIAEGADILDVGGESTRPGAEPVGDRRGAAPRRPGRRGAARSRRRRSAIDTTKLGRGRARAGRRRDLRQRRHRASAATPSWRAASPSAGATAASCTCSASRARCRTTRATTTSSTRSRRFLEERVAFAVARGHRRGAHHARPGHRLRQDASSTTSSCCGASTRSSRSAGRSSSGTSRKSFLGRSPAATTRTSASPRTVAANVLALERGASVFRVHDVAAARDALAVAAATLRADGAEDDEPDDELDDDEASTTTRTRARRRRSSIEISGLSLYTHHGVTEAEREIGQRLVLDLRLEVGECDATVTDLVEDTVDYGEVCKRVALVAQQRSYKTLERLCAAIADRLLDRLRRRGGHGSRRPSPSRRSRCRSRRSRSRSGGRRRARSERLRAATAVDRAAATALERRRLRATGSPAAGRTAGYLAAIVLRAMTAEVDDPARAAALADLPLPAPARAPARSPSRDRRAQRALAEHGQRAPSSRRQCVHPGRRGVREDFDCAPTTPTSRPRCPRPSDVDRVPPGGAGPHRPSTS